jgi:hypothetical protein
MYMQIAEIKLLQVRPEKMAGSPAESTVSRAQKWLPTFSKFAGEIKENIKE